MRLKLVLAATSTMVLIGTGVQVTMTLTANSAPCAMNTSQPDSGTMTLKYLRPSTDNPDRNDYLMITTLKWDSQNALTCFAKGHVDWAYEQNITYQAHFDRKLWNPETNLPNNAAFYLDTTASDQSGKTGQDFGIFRPEALSAGIEYHATYHTFLPKRAKDGAHSFYVAGEVVERNCSKAGPWCVGLPGSVRDVRALIGVTRTFSVNGETCWSWTRTRKDPSPCGPATGNPGPQQTTPAGHPQVHLDQGPSAPAGYRYTIALSGFAPKASVSVICHDSKSPNGFYSFTLTADSAGNANTQTKCYSGDGPDHWVTADGIESNHVRWSGNANPPATSPPLNHPTPVLHPAAILRQGEPAPAGYRYAVTLSQFAPNTTVSVTCYDSVSSSGFYTFDLHIDGNGNATTARYCYSGDGPDHWIVAGGHESNHVSWGGTAPRPWPPATHTETVGGTTHTWTNYINAGGTEGPTIGAYTSVQIACRVTGFKVANGNTWWYRIASPGWDGAYYASADAFYNNGQTSGSLHGTPFVDEAVPLC